MSRRGTPIFVSMKARRHPFTLVEVLVASAILAGVACLMLLASNAVMSTWGKLTTENQKFSELLAVDRTLENMVGNIVPFQWPKDDAPATASDPATEGVQVADPLWFTGDPDRVRFCYRHDLNSLEDGALRFVELLLEDGALVAVYQERPSSERRQTRDTVQRTVLATEVTQLEFRYADWEMGTDDVSWSEQWDPERTSLPLAIWLSVTWADGRDESWLFRTPGSGYAERLGHWQPKQP